MMADVVSTFEMITPPLYPLSLLMERLMAVRAD